jgi:hypothetical protein
MTQVVAGRRVLGGTATADTPRVTTSVPRLTLWRVEDLLRWAITVGIGGIVVAVCWYVCAGDASFGQQIGPANVAVAGLLVAGVGNATWLLKGRRALGERRRALLPDFTAPVTRRRISEAPAEADAPAHLEVYMAGDGMERYHRAGCPLAAGRVGWTTMTREQHEDAGRVPCGVCRP